MAVLPFPKGSQANSKFGVKLVFFRLYSGRPADLPANQLTPSTYMVPQLIKFSNGAIMRVESLIKWMPFGYSSGWSEIVR